MTRLALTGAALIALACTGCATGITGAPSDISPTGATLTGSVVSDVGGGLGYWAEYGRTKAYGSRSATQVTEVAQNKPGPAIVPLSGLERSTLYHYRICAEDSQQHGGPGCGEDRTFITQGVGCGETVTHDVKLTGDLNCAQQPGLIVGAAGIDINLAGHAMFGGIFSGGGGPTGIDNSGGFDDVTIRNGGVSGFGFGIVTKDASRNRIIGIGAGAAGNAVTVEGGDANEIRHGNLSGRSWGIRATGSADLVVAGTSFAGGFSSGLEVSGDGARIVRNRAVTQGVSSSNVSGIRLLGSQGRVAHNYVDGPWPAGGISIAGSNNRVVYNTVLNATPLFDTGSVSDGDGIFVAAFSTGTTLRGNRADSNDGDGIDVRAPATRLAENAAFDNGGWGILAVPGVADLGGNSAGGNGAGQCQNVLCP